MKKTEEHFREYLMIIIRKWVKVLSLTHYRLVIEEQKEEEKSIFSFQFAYPYLDARVKYSKDAFKRWQGGDDLEFLVVHELCHAITDPLYAKATERWASKTEIEDERERLTDRICNLVMKINQ